MLWTITTTSVLSQNLAGKKTLHTKMFHPTTDQWSGKRLPMDGVLVGCSFTLAEFF
jgi:hypothetical protein